jgi:hypothetical protein
MSYFSGNLFQPYTPNASYGYAGYDHRAVHGGLYPHIGTQQLMPYHGDAGWHPGYTGYGQDGAANGAANGAAGGAAGAGAAGLSGADVAALITAISGAAAGFVGAVAQAEAANTLAEQAGLNQQQADKYQAEIAALMEQISAGQASGTQQGAQEAAMTSEQLALLLASAKDEQDEGMSPGAVAAIAIGGVALVGAVIFFATKAGRGAHYGRHSYHY